MANKIRVFGKAQNRTALGIINAYLTLNPKAKLSDLERVFPASLNSALGAYDFTSIFVTPAILKKRAGAKMQCCFEDEPIKLGDGSTIYLFMLWQKVDFDKIVKLAPKYDIEIADYKPANGFEKGGYRLEYINGYKHVKPKKRKGCCLWLLILLILIISAVLLYTLDIL